MKEYMKVGDLFELGVRFPASASDLQVVVATHAINVHDELVAEVERSRGQLAYAFMAGWGDGINGMECDEAEVASVEIAEQFARN